MMRDTANTIDWGEVSTSRPPVYRNQHLDSSVSSIPISKLLLAPKSRPGRKFREKSLDPSPTKYYGDAIIQKKRLSTRIFFHNVKGLTYSTGCEDYQYCLSCLQAYDIDIAGLSETNTCWSHHHLKSEFRSTVRRHYSQNKIIFGSVSPQIDTCLERETFQSGRNLTLVTGPLVAHAADSTEDPRGLGRWSSVTLEGKRDSRVTIITAYRTCPGSIKTSPIGSVFAREYTYLKENGHASLNPRSIFLSDLQDFIRPLQEKGHAIILMLDAKATITSDQKLESFIQSCDLYDLHSNDPAPSSYIGAAERRIDYIFGCLKIREVMTRSGTLSYSEGPQSDHRGLYVDLELGSYFNIKGTEIPPPTHRPLQTGNPELVSSYHSRMLKYYRQHNMEKRIDNLYEKHTSMSRDEVRKLLTTWDNDHGRAMTTAERLLRRPPKKYQWSPTLRNSAIIYRYWKLRLIESQRGDNYQRTFERWHEKLQAHDPEFNLPQLREELSVECIRERLNLAARDFRKCPKSATDLRLKTYQELLATYEDDNDTTTRAESKRKATIVKKTIAAEVCKTTFKHIGQVVKPTTFSVLSKLIIPRRRRDNNQQVPSTEIYDLINTEDPSENLLDTILERRH